MELPDICIVPCVSALQPDTPVGIVVEVSVIVGIVVAVGTSVLVGTNVGVRVSVGVFVNIGVGVGVRVGVFVGVDEGVGEGEGVCVAVLGCHVKGGAVTSIAIDTRMLRALSPIIGPDALDTERSRNGTKLGTRGRKSPWIATMMRVVFADDAVTFGSTCPSHVSKTAVPGPLSY